MADTDIFYTLVHEIIVLPNAELREFAAYKVHIPMPEWSACGSSYIPIHVGIKPEVEQRKTCSVCDDSICDACDGTEQVRIIHKEGDTLTLCTPCIKKGKVQDPNAD